MSEIKCAVYARYGFNQQGIFIEDQEQICRNFVKTKGWKILEENIYVDHAVSHRKPAVQQWKQLLQAIQSGTAPFTCVLIYDPARVPFAAYNVLKDLSYLDNVLFVANNCTAQQWIESKEFEELKRLTQPKKVRGKLHQKNGR